MKGTGMSRINAVALAICALLVSVATADASPKQARHHATAAMECVHDNSGRVVCAGPVGRVSGRVAGRKWTHGDPRPGAWCGWWMRQQLNVADRGGNRAIWWARYGTNAHGPAVGVIVVWRHHVGQITGRTNTGWIVKSGNDGNRVRERERSVRGAVAFRWPNRWAGL